MKNGAAYIRSLFVFSGRRGRLDFFLAGLAQTAVYLAVGLPLWHVYELYLEIMPGWLFWPLTIGVVPLVLWGPLCLVAHRLRDAGLPVCLAFALTAASLAATAFIERSDDERFVQSVIFLFLILLPTRKTAPDAPDAAASRD